ncbi:MAG: AraC family transcriptional regulator, partial [Clostridia bacterium]|nr:AraC family transcriptional regulator [Clostridia bacterium]
MDFELQPIKREIIIDGFNSLYYFEFGKNFSHSLEKHNFWELIYVDSGEVIAVTDGIGRTLTQGQVIFHGPMEIHAHVSNKIVSNSMLVISFSSRSEAMNFFDK